MIYLHIFSNTHNDSANKVLTTALRCIKTYKPYTLTGFEPGIFCAGGGRDGHNDTPSVFYQVIFGLLRLRTFFKQRVPDCSSEVMKARSFALAKNIFVIFETVLLLCSSETSHLKSDL
jgi:hypothetical protein